MVFLLSSTARRANAMKQQMFYGKRKNGISAALSGLLSVIIVLAISFLLYIIGSSASAGWFFSVRKATSVSGSVATVSSPTMSVKLSIP